MAKDYVVDKQDFEQIIVSAGVLNVLTFKRVKTSVPTDDVWEAEPYPGREAWKSSYRVYRWKTGYAYTRAEHARLGEFQGWEETREAAMDACGCDYEIVARLARWDAYQKLTEPPGVTVLLTGEN